MLNISSSELRVIHVWAEKGESSPFPQEIALLTRLKRNVSNRDMKMNAKELEVVLHWAEMETKGHHGMDQYLLQQEELLINKIEQYFNKTSDSAFGP